jgi:ABC-type nitrate/sulfonate/bicarbonate transport system permease component
MIVQPIDTETFVNTNQSRKPRRRIVGIIILVCILGVWQLLPSIGVVSVIILPTPLQVISAGIASAGTYGIALLTTAFEIALSFVLAAIVGITLGLSFGLIPLVGTAIANLFEIALSVPWIIIYPLIVAWVGLGLTSKIGYAFLVATIPVALNATAAVRSIDRDYFKLARSLGATRRDTIVKVLVPAALPSVFAGLRIGFALSVVSVLAGELLVSTSGLGYLITTNQTLFNTGHVYMAIVLTLLLAWASTKLTKWLEMLLSPQRRQAS